MINREQKVTLTLGELVDIIEAHTIEDGQDNPYVSETGIDLILKDVSNKALIDECYQPAKKAKAKEPANA